jgi:hypothetical protein
MLTDRWMDGMASYGGFMASVEVLGKLCARSTRYDDHSASGRAVDALSPAETAGVLAGLDGDAMSYAVSKFMGDKAAGAELKAAVRRHALSLAKRHQWKIKANKVLALADLATSEALSPCRCKRCGGVGFRLARPCSRCKTTGFVHQSGRQMAAAVGICESGFKRFWKDKLYVITAYLVELDSSVRAAVHRNSK